MKAIDTMTLTLWPLSLSVSESMNSMDCSDVAGGNEVRKCNSDNVIIAPVSEELDTLLKQV